MPRISSRRSDASEIEHDSLAEQELLRLQQEYRIMEGDRKAYSEESQYIIHKQRVAIEALQTENEELIKDCKLAGSQANQSKDNQNVEYLSTLLSSEDCTKENADSVKETILDLDGQIEELERKIKHKRKDMGGVHNSKDRLIALQKQIRVLENRLDQSNKKFNHSLAENSKLRQDIDHMRTERTIFEGLYKRLQKKLDENKEEIASVIEASTAAYNARDDAQAKMIALKEKSDKDLAQYNIELKELVRVIDHDRKLREFMIAKGEDRAEMLGFMLPVTARKGEERDKTSDKENTIESYEAAFAKITVASNMNDLDLLVGKFIEMEDRNFALFNYVNELNNEIENLHEQIAETERCIEQFKQESVGMDEHRKEILADLESNYYKAGNEAEVYEGQCRSAQKTLDLLKLGIESLFKKISCDSAPIGEMLGGNVGITDTNMMQFLGLIEQRTNELLQVQAFISAKDEDKAEVAQAVGLLGKGPMPAPSAIDIQPPGTADESAEFSGPSDDDNRPLTQQELRQKVLKGISKKDSTAAKKERDRLTVSGFDRADDRLSAIRTARISSQSRLSDVRKVKET